MSQVTLQIDCYGKFGHTGYTEVTAGHTKVCTCYWICTGGTGQQACLYLLLAQVTHTHTQRTYIESHHSNTGHTEELQPRSRYANAQLLANWRTGELTN